VATIHPLVGVDKLLLGFTREAVRCQIGEPDEIRSEDFGDGYDYETWVFGGRGLDLSFSSEDDYLLVSITVEDVDAELMGRRLIGLEEQVFLATARDAGLRVEFDEDFVCVDSRDYWCDELNLSFWVTEGFLANIGVMPQYDAADEHPVWPSHGAVNPGVERASGS
jgi:hypothetical protein